VSGRILTEVVEAAEVLTANRGYYENSIAHKVEQRQSGRHPTYRDHGSRTHSDKLPPPSQTLPSNAFTASGDRVTGVNFEMWMSPNQSNMDQRLHDFTSLQTSRDLPRCDPSPLEEVREWRSSYPCLAATLDGNEKVPKFDVIMIETSYKTMSDFPPPKATLGLRLELDFGPKFWGELFDWTCTTHIYSNGAPVKQPSHYRLEAKWGLVAPPFESMWWALTFMDKVEQKKQAEETGKSDVYHAFQGRSHAFFAQLTAAHEIRARSHLDAGSQDSKPERELVAVLLWKFSMASESYVGLTSWQRLLLPPARITTNSASPNQQDLSMPPLAMDTIVEGLHHLSEGNDGGDLLGGQRNSHYQDCHVSLDDPHALLIQHDFDMTFKEEDITNFASMQSSFMPSGHGEQEAQSFQTLDHFDYDMHLHGMSTPSHHDLYPSASTNLFETQHVSQMEPSDQHQQPHPQGHVYGLHEFDHDVGDIAEHRPLANFDHNTHSMLPVQRAESAPDQSKQEDEDETLRAALAAASAMNDLGNPPTNMAPHPPSQTAETKHEHLSSALWEDVPLQQSRPQLHTHTSFGSHASYTSHHHYHEQEANTAANDSAVNVNAFDANHHHHINMTAANTDHEGAHEYNRDHHPTKSATPSSPDIRRLLELHNQSFEVGDGRPEQQRRRRRQQDRDRDQQVVNTSSSEARKQEDFGDLGLGGDFVLVGSREGGVERD
jgi:hypothetical protein